MSAKQFPLETHYGKTLFKSLPTLVSKRTHSWSLLHLSRFQLVSVHIEMQWLMKSTSLLHSESSLNAFSTRGLPNKSQFSLKWTPLVLLGRLTTAKVYSTEDPADSGLPTTQDNYLSVLPHRFLTVTYCDLTFTSPKPHLIILFISSPGILLQSFWEGFKVPIQWGFNFPLPG